MSSDFQALILKTLRGPLRKGEVEALATYVAKLEQAHALAQQTRESQAQQQHLTLTLGDLGQLCCTFPGAHPHTVNLSRDPHLTYDFLVTTLRARAGKTNFVGTSGAATQAELERLARASKAKVKKVTTEISLEDLGL